MPSADRAGGIRALCVSPWLIIAVALLSTTLLARFLAEGRIKYGLAIILAAVYGPLVFFDLAFALAVWAAVLFFEELSTLSYGPNGMAVLLALGWIGVFMGRRAPLQLLRQHRRLMLTILLLCIWITLTVAWATDPGAAGAQAGYWWMAALAFLIVVTTIRTARDIRYIALAFISGSIVAVVIGLATGGLSSSSALTQTAIQGRLTGGGGDPNVQAAGFVAAMFLIVGLFSVYRQLKAQVGLMLAFILVTVGFFATQSRGGLIGLAAATCAALVIAPRQRRRIVGLAVLVALAALVLLALHPDTLSRITNVSGGTSGRSDLWKVGWAVFLGHPLVGVGAGNFVVVSSHYVLRPGAISRIQYLTETPQIVHNTYLQLGAEEGLVGLLGFIAVITGSLWTSLLASRRFEAIGRTDYADLTRAVMMGTVGMLTAIFFITDGDDLRLWVLLGLGPVLLGIATRMARTTNPAGVRSRGAKRRWREVVP